MSRRFSDFVMVFSFFNSNYCSGSFSKSVNTMHGPVHSYKTVPLTLSPWFSCSATSLLLKPEDTPASVGAEEDDIVEVFGQQEGGADAAL
jgi:hypothetical protein